MATRFANDGSNKPDHDAKSLMTSQGSTFEIRLWEDRTRGELWVPSYDVDSLALINDDFLRTVNGNAVEAGRRAFEFRAILPGHHRLVFEKRLGWKFTAEDRRVFLIEVVAGQVLSRREHA